MIKKSIKSNRLKYKRKIKVLKEEKIYIYDALMQVPPRNHTNLHVVLIPRPSRLRPLVHCHELRHPLDHVLLLRVPRAPFQHPQIG